MGEKGFRIRVRVQPNASRNEIAGFKEGILQAKVAAPPTKGKVNQELIKLLASLLQISKSSMNIEKGLTNRTKLISISSEITDSEIMEKLTGEKQDCH